jgi:hypothetical protein
VYRTAKEHADAQAAGGRPVIRAVTPRAITAVDGWNGITQANAGGLFPPDINGAISSSQDVEITNSTWTVFTKGNPPAQQLNKPLSTLFGYSAQTIFDPRVLYDPLWKRFVATAEAFPESGSTQCMQLGVSKSSSATGAFWQYPCINMAPVCGTSAQSPFWDYPQLGMTQDAIIVTGNCFRGATYVGSFVFGVAKALAYSGLPVDMALFGPFTGTATPPFVRDANPRAHILVTNAGSAPRDVTLRDLGGGSYATLESNNAITGFPTISVPPSAGQPGCATTSCHLDTGVGRFVAPSSQHGDDLWNVTTLNAFGGFATPTWADFDTEGAGAETTKQSGVTFLSSCSDDFNASLAANTNNKVWLTWSASEGRTCGTTNPSVAVASRKPATPVNTLDPVIDAFTSPATLTGNFDSGFGMQRWGDTSSVSLDPGAGSFAWAHNESVPSASTWGTRIEKVTVP